MNMYGEFQYLNLLERVLDAGRVKTDRTGTGTISLFGPQIEMDISKKFPLLTTKRVFWKGVVLELLWMLQGQTNSKWLEDRGVNIWKEWGDENRDHGPIYGASMRNFSSTSLYQGVDQIENLLQGIREKPDCRRLIVSNWNPSVVNKQSLPPCHAFFQFEVYKDELSCKLYQRSADMFLGVPFNIASYALLTYLIANDCGLTPKTFIHTFGDAHIYSNHKDAVKEQLSRDATIAPPTVEINLTPGKLLAFIEHSKYLTWEEIQKVIILKDYNPMPSIKAEVAV